MGAEQAQAISSHKYAADERIAGTPYRVVRLIGIGGMGSVYEVEHEVLGRRFVFKLLHDRLAARSDLVARMQNEWRALAGLEHPNIVQVTDAGFTRESLPFYVMERLEGQTVAALIRAQKRVDLRTAGRILLDVLSGLEAAHRVYVVHRDIKPQNLFRTTDGTTKLLDFGIAKLQEKSKRVVTQAGVALGTPRYMAPEQAEGKPVDGRADIYACGLVLYELLSGVSPFHHWKEPTEVVLAQIHEEPLRLDAIADDISPEVSDLVQRWLSKAPASRPLSAEIARRELAAVVGLARGAPSTTLTEVTSAGAYDAETLGPARPPEPRRAAPESSPPPASNVRRSPAHGIDATATFADPVASERDATTTGEPYPDEPTRPLFAEGALAPYRTASDIARGASPEPHPSLVREAAVLGPRMVPRASWLPREWRALAGAFGGAFGLAALAALAFRLAAPATHPPTAPVAAEPARPPAPGERPLGLLGVLPSDPPAAPSAEEAPVESFTIAAGSGSLPSGPAPAAVTQGSETPRKVSTLGAPKSSVVEGKKPLPTREKPAGAPKPSAAPPAATTRTAVVARPKALTVDSGL